MCIVINLSHQSTKMVADVAEVTSWIRMKIWDVTLDKGLRDYHLLSCMIHGGFSSEKEARLCLLYRIIHNLCYFDSSVFCSEYVL